MHFDIKLTFLFDKFMVSFLIDKFMVSDVIGDAF